ncbi:MAG: rRNA maturation RNase YbeY [Phycisphaerae bacterium]|nr:rRNA maturation RNase YbeY [Phycisphaerae bacterium]
MMEVASMNMTSNQTDSQAAAPSAPVIHDDRDETAVDSDEADPSEQRGVFDLGVDPDVPLRPEHRTWILQQLELLAPLLPSPIESVRIRVVGDRSMTNMHIRSHGIDEPTDVLTWPAPGNGPRLDGDIAVCIDQGFRNIESVRHGIEKELLLYCLHGILHLAGYDDQSEEDHRLMHAEEDRLLESIGVGSIFNPGSGLSGDHAR